jgi:pimeloyl-ACP methyl ester carboxylesterase
MYIEINNLKVYYQKTGSGKDLILLHGWGQDVSTFWPVIESLKNDFTLWLVDLPGFGRSDIPKKVFTTTDYADLMANFIQNNKIKGAVVLGHSFGGKVAMKLALLYPDLVSKLILEGSAGIKPDPNIIKSITYLLAKFIHYSIPNWFNLKKKIRHKFYTAVESDYENSGQMRSVLVNTLGEDLTADLPRIKTETLLIWGEKDRAVPISYGKRIYKLIKNSRMVTIENAGHFPHLQNPAMFVYFIKLFAL